MAKVYVSSSYLDLKDYCEQVRLVLRRMGYEDKAMEYYVAEDQRPVDKCLADVAACDLYVGVFAWRYGWIPTEKNPDGVSITEMEYRQAVKTEKPRLIFLLSDEVPWPPKFTDKDRTRIEQLRSELSEKHGGIPFSSPDNLASQVSVAIHEWAKKHGHVVTGVPVSEIDVEAYYQALKKRYQRLDLDALTPPQKEEYLQLQLRSVFVEQNVREDPPPVELPKEVWEKLRREKDIHPEDLPANVTLDDVRRAREAYYEKPPRPLLDVLSDPRNQHVIVLGDPGAGKSTLARYVLLSLIDPAGDEKLRRAFDGYLPLLIELRQYAGLCADNKCDTFLEFLEYLGKTEGWHLAQAPLQHYLKHDGRAVVIFDGLDEIFDPKEREQIAHRIVGFVSDYSKTHVIVTSRVIGYRRRILTDAGFSHFTLQDLNGGQVATFVDRWYGLALSDRPDEAKDRRDRIMRSFKESASIRQLAGNPMLLTIMAIISKHQELPRERWKLYDHAASMLIQHWDVKKHLEDQRVDADLIGEEDKKELLRRLSYKMQSGAGGLAGNYIHREQLQAEFEGYLKDRYGQTLDRAVPIARAMIDQFRERNFILSLYGANLYGFVHRAFLEYFCATAFVHRFEKTQEMTLEQLKKDVYGAHWEEQSWREVLHLICGMIDEKFAGEIIDYLGNDVYRSWPKELKTRLRLPWHIALAVQCLGEVRNLSLVAEPATRLLNAVCLLLDRYMEYAPDESLSVLPFLEDSPMSFLEKQIVDSAKSIGTAWPNRGTLVTWLMKPRTHPAVLGRRLFGELIGKFIGSIGKDQKAVHQVISSYARSSDSSHRIVALYAMAMGWREDSQTLPFLRVRASEDKHAFVRYSALSILVEHFGNDPQTLSLLRICGAKEEEEFLRHWVLLTLVESFRDDPQTLFWIQDRAINDRSPLADMQDSKSPWKIFPIRQAALEALARHWPTHSDTVPILHERARNDPAKEVRKRAKELEKELLARSG